VWFLFNGPIPYFPLSSSWAGEDILLAIQSVGDPEALSTDQSGASFSRRRSYPHSISFVNSALCSQTMKSHWCDSQQLTCWVIRKTNQDKRILNMKLFFRNLKAVFPVELFHVLKRLGLQSCWCC
jgi:hypothetical protein